MLIEFDWMRFWWGFKSIFELPDPYSLGKFLGACALCLILVIAITGFTMLLSDNKPNTKGKEDDEEKDKQDKQYNYLH